MILLGFPGDMYGRTKMYGIELVVLIISTVALLKTSNHVVIGNRLK
jgi:hypothetical protein